MYCRRFYGTFQMSLLCYFVVIDRSITVIIIQKTSNFDLPTKNLIICTYLKYLHLGSNFRYRSYECYNLHFYPKLFFHDKKNPSYVTFPFFSPKRYQKSPNSTYNWISTSDRKLRVLLKQNNAYIFFHRSLANVLTITHFLSFIIKNMACHKVTQNYFYHMKKTF